MYIDEKWAKFGRIVGQFQLENVQPIYAIFGYIDVIVALIPSKSAIYDCKSKTAIKMAMAL